MAAADHTAICRICTAPNRADSRPLSASGDGLAAVRERARWWTPSRRSSIPIHRARTGRGPRLCLAALGGYGRRDTVSLFRRRPAVLCARTPQPRSVQANPSRRCCELWDSDCASARRPGPWRSATRLDADNLEFDVSLLDCRYLAGDPQLFTARSTTRWCPKWWRGNASSLVQNLGADARSGIQKYGQHHFPPRAQHQGRRPAACATTTCARWLAASPRWRSAASGAARGTSGRRRSAPRTLRRLRVSCRRPAASCITGRSATTTLSVRNRRTRPPAAGVGSAQGRDRPPNGCAATSATRGGSSAGGAAAR